MLLSYVLLFGVPPTAAVSVHPVVFITGNTIDTLSAPVSAPVGVWSWGSRPTGLTTASLRSHPQGMSLPVPQKRLRHEERAGDGWRGFDTPSRLVEIWSETLAAGGHDPLPHHRAAVVDERLPLGLTMAKVVHYCHAQQRDIASLRRRLPDPLLEMAAADAGARGIANGDWVDVTSATGQVRLKARIAPHMTAGVVCAHYGWAGNNANDLVDFRDADPISGSVNHRGLACEVNRAG